MIISLNWLKKFTDIKMPIDELVTLIGARLVEIEEVIDLGAKYTDALVVKVISVDKLVGSDHLNITKIDDGGVAKNIERDENGFVQVVCGAPNIKAGQLVAWLPPESIVPETFNKPEPFKLGIRNLRGTISNGMIASARELDLFDEHEGILELDTEVVPGTLFAKAYELDDYLLDIENKSLTHRPDCFGIIGFAREVAAISGNPFQTPNWLMNLSTDFGIDDADIDLKVAIDNPELCARYSAVVMSGADGNKKSPLQIQTYLSRVGMRPINAVVDVTNYLMMLTGQPLHAFDYDKLIALNDGKAEIHVRAGREKEQLELLDGRNIELTTNDIVIASGDKAIGLAGAMGGANTVISVNTKRIIIESATFDLYKLRSTQMRHGIFSEAITRFTKGQPAELSAPVLSAAISLITEWSGAKCISKVTQSYPNKLGPVVLEFTEDHINDVLGTSFTNSEITNTLKNAEFDVSSVSLDKIKLVAPYWRSDIHIIEDVVEEVGRLNGFDNIKPMLPTRSFVAIKPSDFDDFRNKARKILVRAGANEVLSYSFVHGDVLQKAGLNVDNSYRIINSISPDLQYYRQTLTPSLLGLVNSNIRQGYDSFAVFEVNKSHQKQDGLTDENVPIEDDMIALVVANKNKQSGASYYQAKRMLDYVGESFGLKFVYSVVDDEFNSALSAPFEYRRSARVIDDKSGLSIGIIGEYKKSVTRNFKLTEYTAGFEINSQNIFNAIQGVESSYVPVSRYPASERDICFKVNRDISYKQIIDAANIALDNVQMETNISPVDIYQPENDDTKNITIRIRLVSRDHTLNSEEVISVISSVIESVIAETCATVI